MATYWTSRKQNSLWTVIATVHENIMTLLKNNLRQLLKVIAQRKRLKSRTGQAQRIAISLSHP
ncbi:hypothetical protein SAMN05216299_10995 [Nitrosospira sp. Nsp14]|nr:hypothetical protein SAMN05216299_10995 [Nitrosospira sp. Nsp14]